MVMSDVVLATFDNGYELYQTYSNEEIQDKAAAKDKASVGLKIFKEGWCI